MQSPSRPDRDYESPSSHGDSDSVEIALLDNYDTLESDTYDDFKDGEDIDLSEFFTLPALPDKPKKKGFARVLTSRDNLEAIELKEKEKQEKEEPKRQGKEKREAKKKGKGKNEE